MLVTSRDTGRSIIPKGCDVEAIKDSKAAARRGEAGELALKAKVLRMLYRYYRYIKRGLGSGASHRGQGFSPEVEQALQALAEKRERRRAWFDLKVAASKVSDPELSTLIGTLQAENGDAGRTSEET